MPFLTLKYKERILRQYFLECGKSLTIGRKETNGIVIDNLSVSGVHAKVDYGESGVFISDLESKNGTFVNDRPVDECRLEDGDVIVIGKHTLEYSSLGSGEAPVIETDTSDIPYMPSETMVLDTDTHRHMVSNILAGAGKGEPEPEARPVLRYMNGNGEEFPLVGTVVTLGRDPSNTIVLRGLFTGRFAATIKRGSGGYYIRHGGGLFKTRVNGEKLAFPLKLEHGDVISIGRVRLKFLVPGEV